MNLVDVAVVGAGAAGLSLAVELARLPHLSSVLIAAPPGPLAAPERTWCTWQVGRPSWDEAVCARWDVVAVHGPDGSARHLDLAPLQYTMVRSRDYEELAGRRLGSVHRRTAEVTSVEDGPDAAVVRTRDGEAVRARWVFDSRPAAPLPDGRTHLLQHFRGWTVRTRQDAFDPSAAGLMDFRTPQPARGVSFGYVLPTSAREALVEWTGFTREPLTTPEYDDRLASYAADVLGLSEYDVVRTEQGAIPMTDATFPRRLGRRVFRIGTAGGATRPSTGYTFTGVHRQTRAVADALRDGRDPVPPSPWSRRHLAMDAIMLRALDTGRLRGAEFFTGLFDRQPASRVLRFLDGDTTLAEDLAVMRASPLGAMVRTLVFRA